MNYESPANTSGVDSVRQQTAVLHGLDELRKNAQLRNLLTALFDYIQVISIHCLLPNKALIRWPSYRITPIPCTSRSLELVIPHDFSTPAFFAFIFISDLISSTISEMSRSASAETP